MQSPDCKINMWRTMDPGKPLGGMPTIYSYHRQDSELIASNLVKYALRWFTFRKCWHSAKVQRPEPGYTVPKCPSVT